MNALAFPCPPGSTWTWQGTRVTVQVFTASGTYTPSPGLVSCVVESIGGGGGGGPAISPGPTYILSGGGGGSGGYSRIALPAPLVVGGVPVTIGAGGAPNTDGLATTFGALCVANGGGQGVGNNASGGWGQGGDPGPPGTGDVTLPGNAGNNGVFLVFPAAVEYAGSGGAMGGAMWGGTIASPLTGVGGTANGSGGWNGTGAGGGGGGVNQALLGASAQGGPGGAGLCIVTEYCVAQSGGSDCGCGPARVSYGWGC